MGIKLHSTFVAAGLPAPSPSMRMEALVSSGTNSSGELFLTTELVAALLPEMERLNVDTTAEVGLETLAGRIRHETTMTQSVILAKPLLTYSDTGKLPISSTQVRRWSPCKRCWPRESRDDNDRVCALKGRHDRIGC